MQRLRAAVAQEVAAREAALALALAAQERELDDKHAKEVVGLRAQVRVRTGSDLAGHPGEDCWSLTVARSTQRGQ